MWVCKKCGEIESFDQIIFKNKKFVSYDKEGNIKEFVEAETSEPLVSCNQCHIDGKKINDIAIWHDEY